MTTDPVRRELRAFVVENFLFGDFDVRLAGDDASFLEAGIIDSTGVLELVRFLENNYTIRISDEELVPENLDSIDNLVRFVTQKRGELATCS